MSGSLAPLVVIGASGHARVVLDAARRTGRFRVVGLVDPRLPRGTEVDGAEVLGDDTTLPGLLRAHPGLACVIGIGDNAARRRVAASLAVLDPAPAFAAVVHPAAVVAASAAVGEGAFVAAGAVVNAGARIGAHAVVNTAASVDHECDVGAFASVGPNAALAGNVTVGEAVMIGIGACVVPGVRIGAEAVVGAGAAVIADVPAGVTVGGVPAPPLHPPARTS